MQRLRPSVLLTVASMAVVLGACGTTTEVRDDLLDIRLGGPCHRLIVFWSMDASTLRALMGDSFEPGTVDALGELQLNVLRCTQQRAHQTPLTFAFFSVPITADSVPIVVTGMQNAGWAWIPAMMVDAGSAAVFSGMGYVTVPAEVLLEVGTTGRDTLVEARLILASGRISITGERTREKSDHIANEALVSTDPQYHSVFAGGVKADRYELVTVDVQVQGDALPGLVDRDQNATRAVLDSALRLEHVYWRLPKPPSESARGEHDAAPTG